MTTGTDIMKALLRLGSATLNPHRRIMLTQLQEVTEIPVEILVLRLCELQQKDLVNIHETDSISVSVTKRGLSETTNMNERHW